MTDLPILERRRIEAQILRHVHDVIAARSGQTEADAVIGAAISRSAIKQGRSLVEALGHTPGFEDFAAIMPNWTKDDALQGRGGSKPPAKAAPAPFARARRGAPAGIAAFSASRPVACDSRDSPKSALPRP